jgi:hypothetical protein
MIAGCSTVGARRAGSAGLLAAFALAEACAVLSIGRTYVIAHGLTDAMAGSWFGGGSGLLWAGILQPACAPGPMQRRLGGRSVPKVA